MYTTNMINKLGFVKKFMRAISTIKLRFLSTFDSSMS